MDKETLNSVLTRCVAEGAADVFIISGAPVQYKRAGQVMSYGDETLTPRTTEETIRHIYDIAERPMSKLYDSGDDDFAMSIQGLSRFRVSAYRQRGSLAAVIRAIPFGVPDYRELGIPDAVMETADRTSGLVIVTGPAGSGKSTTQACMIDRINKRRCGHIITLEDPIEFLHRHDRCIVSQREISLDVTSYVTALRASLRQSPDVILVGEMRDLETTRTVMTAAETGHFIISTLHTIGATDTIDRIIDIFPSGQQQQIRVQLAMLLQSVISQQLVTDVDGKQIPVFEIMHVNTAIRTMIRDAKVHQIDSVIASSTADGMVSMDASLLSLYREGRITDKAVLSHAINRELMEKRINMIGSSK